ncbi:MAG: LysR family transcriptional regulator [Turicibacter sp.]|nr:LysR family transcriptional regulator [Turicibacter sp.]
MIKISYIQEYITLSECLNFSKAAELTYITQPALSRHIAMIEKSMGAKLFERNTRAVKLTPAGQAVYENFCDILSSYEKAKEQASFMSTGKTGILKISSPYYWTEDFTEPIVLHFVQTHPNCDVQIISCQPITGMHDIYEGRADITINIMSDEINDSLRRVTFTKERLCILVRSDHSLAQRNSVKMEELKDESLIFIGEDSKAFRSFNTSILNMLTAKGVKAHQVYYTQQVDTVGMTIKQTGGVCILPYGVRHTDRSYVNAIPLEDSECELNMCIYYSADNENLLIPQFIQAAKSFNIISEKLLQI